MVMKLVLKILLKASIPIVCLVGVMSYGMYMRGGDPGASLKQMVGGSIQSVKSSVSEAGDSLQSVSPVKSASNKTTVYKWVDANGVTQFGSAPPNGVTAKSLTYDNNANIMDAQKPVPSVQAASDAQTQPGVLPNGERMPGVAGMNLPTGVDPGVLSKFLQTMQQQQ